MNINRIFDMLSWKNDTKTQLKGIEEASKIQYLSMFIQPCESKDLWENCAKILDSKTDEELQPYLVELFQWLQDMNWPGADIIYTRLKKFSWHDIQMAYSLCLQMAQKYNDTPWIDVLNEFCQEK